MDKGSLASYANNHNSIRERQKGSLPKGSFHYGDQTLKTPEIGPIRPIVALWRLSGISRLSNISRSLEDGDLEKEKTPYPKDTLTNADSI